MDIQDHSKTTTPTGHEIHEVHLCRRCGWPFPNSHPSSKHRRAHNRICGTIEGYTKLLHSEPVSDDEDKEKTPSPTIEKRIIKESGSSAGGIDKRVSRSEENLFSDAVTEFSDTGISPGVESRFIDTTKLLDSPIEAGKADENPEVFVTPDSHTKDADKTEENESDTQIKLTDSGTKTSVPLVEDKFIDLMDVSSKHGDTFEVSDNQDQGEEAVYVLSVPRDIPLVDHTETLINDFKDHKTIYSNVPRGDKHAEIRSMVDSFEVKTTVEDIHESQTSAYGGSSMESAVSDHEHAQEVIKIAKIDHGVPVLTEAYTQETVKEPENGIEAKQKIVESVASGIVPETVVDEGDSKLMTSQDCGVDASVGSSSRNSLEGNWGSVSVLSTTSIDAENAHSIGKLEVSSDKSRLGKSDAFEVPSLVQPKVEIVDQNTSDIKTVTVQSSQPPKSEANISNETEGRKRNEEAIAKVTNWSTGEHTTTTPLTNLVSEPKSSNPKQLSTMIQKDEVAEKISDPEKSNLTSGTPPVNQESSPPKYIGEGKKVGKKTKGRSSWVPFVCCSSVNVN